MQLLISYINDKLIRERRVPVISKRMKVLIADDEFLICELIKKMILWDELQLEFAGCAHNGQELFGQIQEIRPAIVITDISMPVMDGIELIRQTRYLNIPCRFIIVSGYKQFEYAHNALKYSVDDYILKPINENELNQALKKIMEELNSHQPQAAGETMPAIHTEHPGRSFFLKRIIWEIQDPAVPLEQVIGEYGIDFKPGLFCILGLKLDFANQSADNLDNIGSLNKKLISMFHEEFEDFCFQVLSCIEGSAIYLGINYPRQAAGSFFSHLQEFYQKACNLLDLFAGLKITVGVGDSYDKISSFGQSNKDAMDAAYYRILSGCGQILYWKKLPPVPYLTEVEKNLYLQQFKKAIESVNITDFMATLNQLFFRPKNLFPLFDIIDMLGEICRMLVRMDLSLDQEELPLDYLSGQIHYAIENALSLDALKAAVSEPVSYIFENIHKAVQAQNTRPIRMVLKYIEEHYTDPIRQEDAALLVTLNPAYLSNIFKKETGENFVDYLNSYRIGQARELLKASNLSINEIAYSTGFQDARYFSKLFKKYVGITPKDYRKIYS